MHMPFGGEPVTADELRHEAMELAHVRQCEWERLERFLEAPDSVSPVNHRESNDDGHEEVHEVWQELNIGRRYSDGDEAGEEEEPDESTRTIPFQGYGAAVYS